MYTSTVQTIALPAIRAGFILSPQLRAYLTLLILSVIPGLSILSGQTPHFISHDFEKVSNSRLTVIEQDAEGFLWIGSEGGLYRYDGLNYELYTTSDTIHPGAVTAIFCGEREIWVGYASGRIDFIGRDRTLRAWLPEEGVPEVPITGIGYDRDHRLWFSTYGEGAYVYDQQHLYNFNTEDGLSADQIYDLEVDRNGDVWLATDNGLSICRFEQKRKSVRHLSTEEGLLDEIVYTLTPDVHGMWIGFHRGGFCHFSIENESIDFLTRDWIHGAVRTLCQIGAHDLLVGTEDQGVYTFQIGASPVIERPTPVEGFYGKECHQIIHDREGNIWLIIDHNRIYSGSSNILVLLHSLGDVQAVCEDQDHRVWIGSQQGLFQLKNGELHPTPWQHENIISLYEDKFGNLWIGTFGQGVICWHPGTNRSVRLTEAMGMVNGSVLSIDGYQDRLWLATLGGIVEIFNDEQSLNRKRIRYLNHHTAEGLNANFFYRVFVDRDGVVWFGTDGQGVIRMEHEIAQNLHSEGVLPIRTVYCITQDPAGKVWFGTSHEGVYSFDGDTFRHFGKEEGLRNLAITSLAVDQHGRLIMVHDDGIDQYDPETRTIRYFARNAGVDHLNPALNAISTIDHQSIWIGGHNKIVRYQVDAGIRQIYPNLVFDHIRLFNEPVNHSEVHSFGYQQNFFQFEYVGLWFSDPQEVTYQYQLTGYDMDWKESQDQRISYSSLSPGDYCFRVRSVIHDQPILPSEISYCFEINPPFWSRAWFLTIAGLMIAGLIYAYQRDRELRISRKAAMERERIESQYEVLKAQINPHFLFNSFNTLANIVEEDTGLAVEYIEKLSDYYRSIIQFRDQKMIPLTDELVLIDDFAYLLRRRFGKNLTIVKEIDDTDFDIPPLTLQMLVENAVKHNIISRQKPLTIEIRLHNDDYLVVRNNLQPMKTKEPSTRFGLQNIKTRFELLTKRKVLIDTEDGYFSVSIPLIKPNKK